MVENLKMVRQRAKKIIWLKEMRSLSSNSHFMMIQEEKEEENDDQPSHDSSCPLRWLSKIGKKLSIYQTRWEMKWNLKRWENCVVFMINWDHIYYKIEQINQSLFISCIYYHLYKDSYLKFCLVLSFKILSISLFHFIKYK